MAVEPYQIGVPESAPVVLDNVCGSAVVTDEVLKVCPGAHVHAVDALPGTIGMVTRMIQQRGWEGRIETKVMDGQHLEFDDHFFDSSITNLGIFFFPNPNLGARELCRTLKKRGTAVVTC